jgi:formate hydrogenlyase subunit 3/multisubunit Na+/H+ antiporter MnhD subunit
MLRAEVQVGLGWAAVISLVCMAVIFGAVMSHGRHMLFGARPEGEPVHKTPSIVTVPLIGALAGCGALGLLAWPLDNLLRAAAMVVVK